MDWLGADVRLKFACVVLLLLASGSSLLPCFSARCDCEHRLIEPVFALQVAVFSGDTAHAALALPVCDTAHSCGLNLSCLGVVRHHLNHSYFDSFEDTNSEAPSSAENTTQDHQSPIVLGMLRPVHVECVRQVVLAEMVARACIKWVSALLVLDSPSTLPTLFATGADDEETIPSNGVVLQKVSSLLALLHGEIGAKNKTDPPLAPPTTAARAVDHQLSEQEVVGQAVDAAAVTDWARPSFAPGPVLRKKRRKKRIDPLKRMMGGNVRGGNSGGGGGLGRTHGLNQKHEHEHRPTQTKQSDPPQQVGGKREDESKGEGRGGRGDAATTTTAKTSFDVADLDSDFFWRVYVKTLVLAKYGGVSNDDDSTQNVRAGDGVLTAFSRCGLSEAELQVRQLRGMG